MFPVVVLRLEVLLVSAVTARKNTVCATLGVCMLADHGVTERARGCLICVACERGFLGLRYLAAWLYLFVCECCTLSCWEHILYLDLNGCYGYRLQAINRTAKEGQLA